MILQTAIAHFNQDIQRARNLKDHAVTLQDMALKEDIFRAAWMTAVGAFDAYFCDAYGDLVARTLRAKKAQSGVILPTRLNNIMVPIPAVLDNTINSGWIWRMIARGLIERDNVLSAKKIKELFNVFFRDSHKLFTASGAPIVRWIENQHSINRLVGFTRTQYRAAIGNVKANYRKKAIERIDERLTMIFQRRHDCIHNCDRPKFAVNSRNLNATYVRDVIADIEYIVSRCHEDLITEFPIFLTDLGFNAVVRNSVGS